MTDVDPLIPQITLRYRTFIRKSLVSALRLAMAEYSTDITLRKTKVDIEYSTNELDYPAIVVKYYETDILDAGVGHLEWGEDPNAPGYYIPYQHRHYHGNVEFEIYGLSSLDRDLVADAVVEILSMGQVNPEASTFFARLYTTLQEQYYKNHYLVLNIDAISGGDDPAPSIAPWGPEDTLLYQTSYRVPVMGEFYSLAPTSPGSTSLLTEVDLYPWDVVDPLDTPPQLFPGGVIPDNRYIKLVDDGESAIIGVDDEDVIPN